MGYLTEQKLNALDKDEFYHDILDGLSVYLDSPFILDILHAIREYPMLRLGQSLNLGQVTSKKWLLDSLADVDQTRFGTIYILGGWYGVLAAMFLHDPRFEIDRAVSVDIDPSCEPIARALNRCHVESGKFDAITQDVHDLNYSELIATGEIEKSSPDLLVNTSCEHLPEFQDWFGLIPDHALMAIQSNDYFDCDEHTNCVADLESFGQQAPFSEVMYQGQLQLKKYTRFMRIGRKMEACYA